MTRFRDLLSENPDTVYYKRKTYSYTTPANRCAFFVYKDDVNGKNLIFAYSDEKKQFYSDDSDVLKEIKELQDGEQIKYSDDFRNDFQGDEQSKYWAQQGIKRLKASNNGGGHLQLENILKGLRRMNQYADPITKGRIFEVDNTDGKPPENLDLQIESTIPSGKAIIVTFWDYNKEKVIPYKEQYEKVIEFNGYNPEECLYEIGSGIISYDQLYDKEEPKKETPPPESKPSDVDKADVVFKVGDKVRLKGFKDVVGDVTHIDGDYVTVNITSSKYSLGPFRQGRDIKQLASGMELVQPDVGTKSSDSFKVGDKIKIVGMDIKADVTAIKGNNVSIKVTDSNLLSLPVGTEFDYPNWGLQKIEEQPSLEKVIHNKNKEFVEKSGKLHSAGAVGKNDKPPTPEEKAALEKEVDGLDIEIKILRDLLASGEKYYTDNIKDVVATSVQRKLHALEKEKKNRYSLIAQAEKQYGMPIAQIRQKYRGIPLDKLVKKESLYKKLLKALRG
jgi:hypothetical protein